MAHTAQSVADRALRTARKMAAEHRAAASDTPDAVDHASAARRYYAGLRYDVALLAALAEHVGPLGRQLRAHAFCSDHSRASAVPEECPFCEDRAVYDAYAAAAGIVDEPYTGGSVDILADLAARRRALVEAARPKDHQ